MVLSIMIERIGHYKVVDKIGEGGMGVVYKAQDPRRFNRIVAVKTIKDQQDNRAVEQFIKEAEVLSQLFHPNLVKIEDFGEFEEEGVRKPYLVMEFLFGRTLQEIIKKREALSIDRKLYIIIQACRGLHAAHEAGLIHRDIKPSNLFVLEEDFVKIIDFGIARASSSEMTLEWKGTPYYMSPEQIELKEAPSRRSDIFSLGVVFYELLTYSKPYTGESTQEVFDCILNRSLNPRPIKEINSAVDDPICRIVEKALAKDPRKRFNTAREMAELLEKARKGEYIEVFDVEKIQTRITKAKKAAEDGNFLVAESILQALRSEGFHLKEVDQLEKSIQRLKDEHLMSQLMKTATDLIKEQEYELALEKLDEVIKINAGHEQALGLRSEVKEKIQAQAEELSMTEKYHEAEVLLNKTTSELSRGSSCSSLAGRVNEEKGLSEKTQTMVVCGEGAELSEPKRAATTGLPEDKKADRERRFKKTHIVIGALLVLAALGGIYYFLLVEIPSPPSPIPPPSQSSQNGGEAEENPKKVDKITLGDSETAGLRDEIKTAKEMNGQKEKTDSTSARRTKNPVKKTSKDIHDLRKELDFAITQHRLFPPDQGNAMDLISNLSKRGSQFASEVEKYKKQVKEEAIKLAQAGLEKEDFAVSLNTLEEILKYFPQDKEALDLQSKVRARRSVRYWISQAERAFEEGKYVLPENDNVAYYMSKVSEIDPGTVELNRLWRESYERAVQKAEELADRNQCDEAARYLVAITRSKRPPRKPGEKYEEEVQNKIDRCRQRKQQGIQERRQQEEPAPTFSYEVVHLHGRGESCAGLLILSDRGIAYRSNGPHAFDEVPYQMIYVDKLKDGLKLSISERIYSFKSKSGKEEEIYNVIHRFFRRHGIPRFSQR